MAAMRKTWLVARHEFSVTLGRLSYRIFAASVPVLAIVALIGIAIFQAMSSDDTSQEDTTTRPEGVTFGYVDLTTAENGQPLFTGFQRQGDTVFTPYTDQEAATRELLEGRIGRLFVFPADYLETGTVLEVREEQAGLFDTGVRNSALRRFVVENLFAEQVGPEGLQRIVTPYRLVILVIDEVSESGGPADEDDGPGDSLPFIAASILLLVSVFTASGYLLQGLTEEKENRIMEVLLSSIKPEHLMFGKLIGLGAASLLQMAVWSVTVGVFLLVLNLIIDLPIELTRELVPSPARFLIAFAYFLLGYGFIGTLLAAIGAVTTNQRQAGNITTFVILPAIAPMWFMVVLLENPDGTLARALSFIPITAPVTSLTRLSLGGMDGIDVFLSLAVLTLSVAVVVWLTARLFRAYLLVYGQQPSMGHLIRTLRGR